jgi:hypothetical protein
MVLQMVELVFVLDHKTADMTAVQWVPQMGTNLESGLAKQMDKSVVWLNDS